MAALFKGNGLVFIPGKGRCIRFVGGEYATSDDTEIAVLSAKYECVDVPEAPQLPASVDVSEQPKKRGRKPREAQDVD